MYRWWRGRSWGASNVKEIGESDVPTPMYARDDEEKPRAILCRRFSCVIWAEFPGPKAPIPGPSQFYYGVQLHQLHFGRHVLSVPERVFLSSVILRSWYTSCKFSFWGMEVLGNHDRPTNQPTDRLTDQVIGKVTLWTAGRSCFLWRGGIII